MKKGLILLMFVMLILPLAAAGNLEVEKVDKGSVIISELNNPAVFEFTITNKGPSDNFEIYSLLGISMSPKGTFEVPSGKSVVEIKVYPNKEIQKYRGLYYFEYQIKGSGSEIFKDKLGVTIAELRDAIEAGADNFSPDDAKLNIVITNKLNTNLEDVKINFKSLFFDAINVVSLKPYETIRVPLNIDKARISKIVAGQYPLTADIQLENAKARVEGNFKYLEKEGISVVKQNKGIISRKIIVTKTNEGNVPATAKIEIEKDIISRLFTTFTSEPLTTQRNNIFVKYSWGETLGPHESLSITSSTNYTFPFVLIILVILVTVVVKIYTQTVLVLNKRVSYVKTKGGQFALKVRLHVKARKHLSNIQIIDRLPGMTKLYDKGGRMPDKVDEQTRRLFWNISHLNAGEERLFSYIIYSTINVIGKFELPVAMATFDKDGSKEQVLSNRTFFMAETGSTDY